MAEPRKRHYGGERRRGRARRTRLLPAAIGAGLVATLVTAGAAGADWLVLADGSRVETDGGWTVKGRLVVFKDRRGALSSLRLSEVDVAASERATAEAAAPPPAPPAAEPRKPVLVLTDADIPPADPAAVAGVGGSDVAAAEAAEEGEGAGGAGGAAAGPGLEVESWQQVEAPDGSGIQVLGTLVNRTEKLATDLQVRVALYDAAGQELDSRDAVIGRKTLAPGARASFNVSFPGVFAFSAAKFEPRHRSFETRSPPQPAAGEAPAAPAAPEEAEEAAPEAPPDEG
jgi:hypothetical protein